MRPKFAILSVLALVVGLSQRAQASRPSDIPQHDRPAVVFNISDLRSAYLLRAGVVRYDESNRTPAGLRRQLQHHFDVVLSLLRFATPKSIAIAVARLEASDDHSWTSRERNAWRQKLLAARRVQLQRLAAYRDRGIFPLNEGQAAHAVPIFVDRHGTACAVGHLMRCSGWTNVVDSIQKSNDLVYVPDAARSAIAAWVLTSGLTLEEAAVIQPGYSWPGEFDASAYAPGGSALEKDGLRFSNFQLVAQNFNEPSHTLSTTGSKPTLAGLGLLTGAGTYTEFGFLEHDPIGTNWLAIAGSSVQPPLHALNASADAGHSQYIEIHFDVSPVDPNQRINGIAETDYWMWDGFDAFSANASYYLETDAFDGANDLATLYFDQTPSKSWVTNQSFAPKPQIHVETYLWLDGGVSINTYVLDFNVVNVPEPANGFLAAMLMSICGMAGRKGAANGERSDGKQKGDLQNSPVILDVPFELPQIKLLRGAQCLQTHLQSGGLNAIAR